MANTTYATRAELELRVNTGTDAADDTMLQEMLNTAAYMTDELTRGWRQGYEAFSASASEARLFDDYGLGTVEIDDLLSATVLTRGGTTITTTYYKLYPYNELPRTQIKLRADAPSYATDNTYWLGTPLRSVGTAQISVTGLWGYCTEANRPPIVKEITLQIAEMLYMEMGLSTHELMLALRNPVTDAEKRITGLTKLLRRDKPAVLFA